MQKASAREYGQFRKPPRVGLTVLTLMGRNPGSLPLLLPESAIEPAYPAKPLDSSKLVRKIADSFH
jgi:hypothetical protein